MSKNYLQCLADYIAGHSRTNCGLCLEFLSLTEADCSAIFLSFRSQRRVQHFLQTETYLCTQSHTTDPTHFSVCTCREVSAHSLTQQAQLTLFAVNLSLLLDLPVPVKHDLVPQLQPVQQRPVGTLQFTEIGLP
jgi:hypothetical protein